MPREVKAYACIFGCGTNAAMDMEAMEGHEQACFCNPARRACKTCKHDHRRRGTDPVEDWSGIWCDIDALPYDLCITTDCPSWEPRGEVEP